MHVGVCIDRYEKYIYFSENMRESFPNQHSLFKYKVNKDETTKTRFLFTNILY